MTDWTFHEKHSPGIQTAWALDVDQNDRHFIIGVSGSKKRSNMHVIAWDVAYAETQGVAGQCFEYVKGRWTEVQRAPRRTIFRLGGVA